MGIKKIERDGLSPHTIKITDAKDGYIESSSVTANLLYEILQKLEEIRCGIIDVEDSIETKTDNPALERDG